MGLFTAKRDFVIGEEGIDTVEKVNIGGIAQSILIQGEDVTNPILLFVHGGPSLPLPGISSRGKDYTITTNTIELVKHYVLVFWDQRGTGKSYHSSIPKDSMTIGQFVSDALEITDYLREKFQKEKIFLAGHSWGSIIGLMAASSAPDKYYSYISFSQIVNWAENDKLALAWAKEEAKKRNNQKALRELASVGEPPYVESFRQWGVLRKWQRKFNSLIYTDEYIKHPGLTKLTIDMLRSVDYTWRDMVNTFYKGFQLVYSDEFIREIPSVNFLETVNKLDIPITFIHGTKDVQVFGNLVEEYYLSLEAVKGKRLLWLDKSGHVFHPDDTKVIEQYLIEEKVHLAPRKVGV